MNRLNVVCVFVCLVSMATNSSGYLVGTTYNWDSSVPNYNPSAIIHTGTIGASAFSSFADFIGNDLGQSTAAYHGTHVNWDDGSYAWGDWGNADELNAFGDTLNGYWVGLGSFGGWWDLGAPSSLVTIFGSQTGIGTSFGRYDYLEEGLDYTVFGANVLRDNTSLGAQATVTEVYLDGWRPHNPSEDTYNNNGWCHDDVTAVFDLHGSYRYIRLLPADFASIGYPEIDAVAPGVVPLPGAAMLGLLGLGAAGMKLRKRRVERC